PALLTFHVNVVTPELVKVGVPLNVIVGLTAGPAEVGPVKNAAGAPALLWVSVIGALSGSLVVAVIETLGSVSVAFTFTGAVSVGKVDPLSPPGSGARPSVSNQSWPSAYVLSPRSPGHAVPKDVLRGLSDVVVAIWRSGLPFAPTTVIRISLRALPRVDVGWSAMPPPWPRCHSVELLFSTAMTVPKAVSTESPATAASPLMKLLKTTCPPVAFRLMTYELIVKT